MSEKFPTPKAERPLPTPEEMAKYDDWMDAYPVPEIVQDSFETCAEKIAEFENLLANFEQTYDLEALRAITQFSSREERLASPRQPASKALTPIVELLNYLLSQKAVPNETYEDLKKRHEALSRAVGNAIPDASGKTFEIVLHDRQPSPTFKKTHR